MVNDYEKKANLKISNGSIEEILVDKPEDINLFLRTSALEIEISLKLNENYSGAKLVLFELYNEETAEKVYNKLIDAIKSGNYKLRLYSNGKIEFKLETELEKELGEVKEKDNSAFLERVTDFFSKLPNDFRNH